MGISINLKAVHIPQAALTVASIAFAVMSQMPRFAPYSSLLVTLSAMCGGSGVAVASTTDKIQSPAPLLAGDTGLDKEKTKS